MSASKRKAKQKLAQIEREAKDQDAKSEENGKRKLRKRQINWEQNYWTLLKKYFEKKGN